MADIEKVINDLLEVREYIARKGHDLASRKCRMMDKITDALDLLKEQEEYKPKGHWTPYEPDKRGYTDGFECSRCERVILSDHYCKMIDFDFCPYCGAYMDNAEGR